MRRQPLRLQSFMPKGVVILRETIDPLARMIRGLDELSDEEAAERPGLPIGFCGPEVLLEFEDGSRQPLRQFEYEVIRGREEPLSDERTGQMWTDIQGFLGDGGGEAQRQTFLDAMAEVARGQVVVLEHECQVDELSLALWARAQRIYLVEDRTEVRSALLSEPASA